MAEIPLGRIAPVFNSQSERGRKPKSLSHDMPRMAAAAKERVAACLAGGCHACDFHPEIFGESKTATLTRRAVRGGVNVWLQCDTCGGAVGSSLKRDQHFFWQTYPEWDDAKAIEADARQQAHYQAGRKEYSERIELAQSTRDLRKQKYADWLQNSPTWKALRAFVLRRANWICEGCLNEKACDVHHETYEMGWVPPAWLLRAVCRQCHQRLHDGWHEDGTA